MLFRQKVFTTGKEKAQQALNIYSHIDYLRPYFEVEPKEVLNRLFYSVIPLHQSNNVKIFKLSSLFKLKENTHFKNRN